MAHDLKTEVPEIGAVSYGPSTDDFVYSTMHENVLATMILSHSISRS